MKREEKEKIIDRISERISNNNTLYLSDISELDALETSQLRRSCFEKGIELIVVKNTLLTKAFDKAEGDYEELKQVLKGHTSIMFAEQGSTPAKLIKEFRNTRKKPVLKAAYIEESVYIGDDKLDTLSSIKSKDELIADIILLLQTPAKNVISGLKSGSAKLSGILKTLSEKEDK